MDIMTIILFIIGLVLLISGAEVLVRGASNIAIMMGVSPLIVGLTVVAFGTSSPELAVTIQSSFQGEADIALGNVVGSNIANILLILGVGAMVTPLIVARQLVRLELPIVIGISVLMYVLGLDNKINRWDGLLLFAGGLAYIAFTVVQSRGDSAATEQAEEVFAEENPKGGLMLQFGFIVLGLVMLVIGSTWLVDGAVAMARYFGLSELIIGLTIIAIGTSLPEVATVVVASLKGERDIAVGNAVGSNIFNILIVMGLCAAVAPDGVNVMQAALRFDMPIMIAVAIVCLPIFFSGYVIDRWEGIMFLIYYAAYLAYLVLQATEHDALSLFNNIMLVIIPLTILTLAIIFFRNIRMQSQERQEVQP